MKTTIILLLIAGVFIIASCTTQQTNNGTQINLSQEHNEIKTLIQAQQTPPACPQCVCTPCTNDTAAVMVLQDRITLLKGRIDYYQGMEEEEVLYNLTRNIQR